MDALAATLRQEGLSASPADFRDAFRDRGHVTIVDEQSEFRIDVVIAAFIEEALEVDRAVGIPYREGRLPVVSAEDTIALKLRFGSPQDLQDARSILVRQAGRLDEARLLDMAQRLGVEDALREHRAEIDDVGGA